MLEYTYIHYRNSDKIFAEIKCDTYELLGGKSIFINYPFLENTKVCEVCKNKEENDDCSRFILVKGWSIEDHVIKVVEGIAMDFDLLILHKANSLVTIELLSREPSFSLRCKNGYHKSHNGWFLSTVVPSSFIFGLSTLYSKKILVSL